MAVPSVHASTSFEAMASGRADVHGVGDVMDLRRGRGDGDPWVDQPGINGDAGTPTAGPRALQHQRIGDREVAERVDAGRLEVEGEQAGGGSRIVGHGTDPTEDDRLARGAHLVCFSRCKAQPAIKVRARRPVR